MTIQITASSVTNKLREIRRAKSLSLKDVELLSNSSIKAVVLGSYERGARSLSVKRAISLAELYQIPVSELFGASPEASPRTSPKLLLDLKLVRSRSKNSEHHYVDKYRDLMRLLEKITYSRQDWNGEVISIRESDISTMSLLLKMSENEVLFWITEESVLLQLKK